jgi:hypothetical protein
VSVMAGRFWSRGGAARFADSWREAGSPTGMSCPTAAGDDAAPATGCFKPRQELIAGLSPRAVSVLAGLHGVPKSVAEATMQLLPFGSRAGLEAKGLVVREKDDQGGEFLRLTPNAYKAMGQAAAQRDGTTEAANKLGRELERLHQEFVSRPR